MDMDMLKRPVNVGFSGGEKKRAEMVQMGILDPRLAILDETDRASTSMRCASAAKASTRSCASRTRRCC
jgi:ABC-type glutathione transport system ATPase component